MARLTSERRTNILGKLPLELFAKVLENLHPVDILAIARTNRELHRTLRNQDTEHFYWKISRQRFVNPVPPDPVVMSEYAMASLLFDYGECMICGNRTRGQVGVRSYAFGERVCRWNPSCRIRWEETFSAPPNNMSVELIHNLVPSVNSIVFLSGKKSGGRRARSFSNVRNPRKPYASLEYLVYKKRHVESIAADLKAGLTEEQLQGRYTLAPSPGTRRRYELFLGRLCSVVERLSYADKPEKLRSSIRDAFKEEYRQGWFSAFKESSPAFRTSRAMAERNLPYDYVLSIMVETGDPDHPWETMRQHVARDVYGQYFHSVRGVDDEP